MSVCSIHRRYDNTGSVSAERNQLLYEVARGQFAVSYNVRVTSHLDGPFVILTDALTPKLGQSYAFGNDSYPLATCVKVSVPVRLSRRRWKIDCEYDTDRLVAPYTDDPLRQPPEITKGSNPYSIAIVRDANGRVVANSAMRAFDPPPTVDEKVGVWVITRNEAVTSAQAATYLPLVVQVFNSAFCDGYEMTCNRATWANKPQYTARINVIRAARIFSYGRLCWQVAYEIEVKNPRTFYEYVLDQSWTDIDEIVFTDTYARPMANQTLLNGRGRALRTAITRTTAPCAADDNTLTCVVAEVFNHFPEASSFAFQPFEVSVDDEVMEVSGYAALGVMTVTRGIRNTVAAAHSVDAIVKMEPYFLRFKPHKTTFFADLNLPALP